MAQTGFTPIQIYSSSTAAAAPTAGNLANSTLGSELAINITDGKLFYKDNANAVQVIAWKVTPTSAGGTGLTSYAAGDLLFYATGTALSKLTIGASATVLTSSGSAPQWTAQSALSVGTAANLLSNATTGVMQVTGPGTGTTRVMTIPNANFTAARTDAGQSFTGNQAFISSGEAMTLGANATASNFAFYLRNTSAAHAIALTSAAGQYLDNAAAGDLIIGAPTGKFQRFGNLSTGADRGWFNDNGLAFPSGKGIDFSATPGTGTSELLDDYEEGYFNPTLTCGTSGTITLSAAEDTLAYTKIGRVVNISGQFAISSVASPVGTVTLNNLPFAVASLDERAESVIFNVVLSNTTSNTPTFFGLISAPNGTTLLIRAKDNVGAINTTPASLFAASDVWISGYYLTAA